MLERLGICCYVENPCSEDSRTLWWRSFQSRTNSWLSSTIVASKARIQSAWCYEYPPPPPPNERCSSRISQLGIWKINTLAPHAVARPVAIDAARHDIYISCTRPNPHCNLVTHKTCTNKTHTTSFYSWFKNIFIDVQNRVAGRGLQSSEPQIIHSSIGPLHVTIIHPSIHPDCSHFNPSSTPVIHGAVTPYPAVSGGRGGRGWLLGGGGGAAQRTLVHVRYAVSFFFSIHSFFPTWGSL